MLKQELDINWSPGTVLVRREKKKKIKIIKIRSNMCRFCKHRERGRREGESVRE